MLKAKRIMALVMVVAVLLGIALMSSGCSKIKVKDVEKDPDAQVKESLQLTVDALKASGANSPLTYIANTLKKGSVTLQYGDKETAAFTNTMYFDSDKGNYADTFVMESADEKTELSLYLSGQEVAVKLPAQVGGKTVGTNLKNFMDDMKDADGFWAMTGMTYEEFDAQFGSIVSQIGAEKKENALIELLRLKESLDKAKKIIEDCDVDVEEKKVVTGTEDVKAINVVYSMSTKELKALADIASEWFGGNYEAIFEELTGQLPEEAGVDAYAAEILAAVNSIKAALDETKANVKLTFSINPSSGLIMKVECVLETTVEEEKEYITVNVDFGKDLRKSSEYQINFITSSGIESAASKVTIGYQIKDSEGMYHRRLYCKVLGDEVDKTIEFVLKWNTKSEVFTAEFDSVDTNMVISGGAGVKSGNLWLTIDKVTVNREATEVGLKLEFDPGANTPKMPKYTNIADLSASDWEEITSMLGAAQVN